MAGGQKRQMLLPAAVAVVRVVRGQAPAPLPARVWAPPGASPTPAPLLPTMVPMLVLAPATALWTVMQLYHRALLKGKDLPRGTRSLLLT